MTVRVKREKESQIEYYGAASGELLGSSAGVRTSVTITATDDYLIIVPKNGPNKTQVEQGSFPTSYIKTEGSQVTRAADICSIDTDQFGYNSKEGTVVVEFSSLVPLGARTNDGVFSLEEATANLHRIYLGANDHMYWQMRAGGSSIFAAQVGSSLSEDQEHAVAVSWKSGNQSASFNGGSATNYGTSSTLPAAATTLKIGYINVTDYLNGHIKSIDYIPRRLTNEQLQELTS